MPPIELDLPVPKPEIDEWGGKNNAALLTLLQAVNNTIASLDVRSGHLWSIHTDGTENDLGALPVAPGGTDAGVAGYLESAGSLSGAATKALVASDIEDGGPVGDAVSAQIHTHVGPAAPTQYPAGTEYVWFKTDGNGVALDILTGKV